MIMKKIVLIALILVLGIGMVFAGGGGQQTATGTSGWPKVTFGFQDQDYALREQEGTWPSDIFNALREKLQIDLQFIGYTDTQQLDLAIAAGELTDVIMVGSKTYQSALLAGDLVQPMDDYLHLAPNLVASSPLRIAASRKYNSKNGDGKFYFLNPNAGISGTDKAMWNGMTIRWDYYKELGYPEVKTEDDFLNVVAAAVARHPTTPDGKKVYGVATYSDGSLWGWWVRGALYGFVNITDGYSLGYSKTEQGKIDRVVSNFTDYDSPVWRDIVYYRKANKLGIFDPDSLIMKGTDLNQKSSDGQIVAPNCTWYGGDLYTIQRDLDPNTMAQYMVLPVEGQYNWSSGYTSIGWNHAYAITKNAKNVETIMKLIDFLSTPEGVRFVSNGPEGKLWNITNGVPKLTPEAIALQRQGGKEWQLHGEGIWSGFNFITASTLVSDGGPANLFGDPDLFVSTLTPAEKDFSSHYGVSYPSAAALNLIKQGKAWDRTNQLQDLLTLLPAPPTNIKRIDDACLDIMLKAIPRLVLETSDAAFETLRTQLQRDLQAAGIQTSNDWWFAQERDIKSFLATVN
jgi:ABC-type glycerol-3-phosphate transport system substrate-binding protein